MKLEELDNVVDSYISILTESAYHDYFKTVLAKYGVKSPFQLPPDKKKQFFTDVKKGWAAEKGKEAVK
jgi:hypothetical protein